DCSPWSRIPAAHPVGSAEQSAVSAGVVGWNPVSDRAQAGRRARSATTFVAMSPGLSAGGFLPAIQARGAVLHPQLIRSFVLFDNARSENCSVPEAACLCPDW